MIIGALVATFLATLLIGVPIAFVLGLSGLAALVVWDQVPFMIVAERMFSGMDSYVFSAVPFFILIGEIMAEAGMLPRLVRFARALVGPIRGGLAHVATVSGVLLAGISGSAVADTAALGSTLVPMMEKAGYTRRFAAAVTSAAGTLGPIIPPSVVAIIYASAVSNVSIGALFLAGVIPGLAIASGIMAISFFASPPQGPGAAAGWDLRELGRATREALVPLVLPVLILGGLLGGAYTATEAGAVGAVYVLIVWVVGRNGFSLNALYRVCVKSAETTAVVFLVLATSQLVAWVLATQQVPVALTSLMQRMTDSPEGFLLFVNLLLLFMGCVESIVANIAIFAPILVPVAAAYGIDPVHFGLVVVLNLCIGYLTPPVGAVLFISSAVCRVPMNDLVRELLPFLAVFIAVLMLATYWPAFAVALPRAVGY